MRCKHLHLSVCLLSVCRTVYRRLLYCGLYQWSRICKQATLVCFLLDFLHLDVYLLLLVRCCQCPCLFQPHDAIRILACRNGFFRFFKQSLHFFPFLTGFFRFLVIGGFSGLTLCCGQFSKLSRLTRIPCAFCNGVTAACRNSVSSSTGVPLNTSGTMSCPASSFRLVRLGMTVTDRFSSILLMLMLRSVPAGII